MTRSASASARPPRPTTGLSTEPSPAVPWSSRMPDTTDILAIHELLGLYGHIIDAREWERVHELFTDDCTYDMTQFGLGVVHGAQAVRALWAGPDAAHPLAHHATNI